MRGEWYGGFADRELVVWDLQATNATARAALWEFVFGVDLVVKIIATNLPIDEPLRFMLADPRQLRTDFVYDSLYVLPLEVATLLSARTYASDGVLTIEVVEPGGPKGRFVLDGSPDGASCREAPDATPELTCSRAALGAVLLGGNSWTTLLAAGEIDEHSGGAVARARRDVQHHTRPGNLDLVLTTRSTIVRASQRPGASSSGRVGINSRPVHSRLSCSRPPRSTTPR